MIFDPLSGSRLVIRRNYLAAKWEIGRDTGEVYCDLKTSDRTALPQNFERDSRIIQGSNYIRIDGDPAFF